MIRLSLNQGQRFCQLKSFSLLVLFIVMTFGACSKADRKSSEAVTNKLEAVGAIPVWFQAPVRFSHRGPEESFISHPFFDLVPFSSMKDNSINFIMTTPRESTYQYDLDIHSGRLYRVRRYCKQDDVWKNYPGTIVGPKFSLGVVPRLLDQIGNPQQIVVFGDLKYFQPFSLEMDFSQRVRVVGGFTQQYCRDFPCGSRRKWISRLVLVAVNPLDPHFAEVTDLAQLKKKADWQYLKAFYENGFGRKDASDSKSLPAYRFVGEVSPKKALSYAIKKGHLFKFEDIKTLRKSCHTLYDHLWKSVLELRQSKDPEKKEVVKKSERNVVEKDFTKIQAQKKTYQSFVHLFSDFHQKYSERFKTCQKYVRPSSINDDIKRHWFFSFVMSYMNAEELGYFYHCGKNTWVRNIRQPDGKWLYNPKEQWRNCSEADLDRAFERSLILLNGLYRSQMGHYRYIEYDDKTGGSHQKLYSWVFDNGKRLACNSGHDEYEHQLFPEDIAWETFYNPISLKVKK